MPISGTYGPVTGSWFARVTSPRVPADLSLTSHAQPLPWIPASAVFICLTKASKEPKSESIAVCGGVEG